jgi:hypothetical protein
VIGLVPDARHAVLARAALAVAGETIMLFDYLGETVEWEIRLPLASVGASYDADRRTVLLMYREHVDAIPIDRPMNRSTVAEYRGLLLCQALFAKHADDIVLLAASEGILFHDVRQRAEVGRLGGDCALRIMPLVGAIYAVERAEPHYDISFRLECLRCDGIAAPASFVVAARAVAYALIAPHLMLVCAVRDDPILSTFRAIVPVLSMLLVDLVRRETSRIFSDLGDTITFTSLLERPAMAVIDHTEVVLFSAAEPARAARVIRHWSLVCGEPCTMKPAVR